MGFVLLIFLALCVVVFAFVLCFCFVVLWQCYPCLASILNISHFLNILWERDEIFLRHNVSNCQWQICSWIISNVAYIYEKKLAFSVYGCNFAQTVSVEITDITYCDAKMCQSETRCKIRLQTSLTW